MVEFNQEYVAAGGNRHPAAADWDSISGILAYGADNNVALWKPLVSNTYVDTASKPCSSNK